MSLKKTIKEFIAEARKVHGDRYDYSKVGFVPQQSFPDLAEVQALH